MVVITVALSWHADLLSLLWVLLQSLQYLVIMLVTVDTALLRMFVIFMGVIAEIVMLVTFVIIVGQFCTCHAADAVIVLWP